MKQMFLLLLSFALTISTTQPVWSCAASLTAFPGFGTSTGSATNRFTTDVSLQSSEVGPRAEKIESLLENWLAKKLRIDRSDESFQSTFALGGVLEKDDFTLEVERFQKNKNEYFAFRLTHGDQKFKARRWQTDVILRIEEDRISLRTQLQTLKLSQDYLPEPNITAPRFINQILQQFNVSSGSLPLRDEPYVLDHSRMARFIDLLKDPYRKLPIVLISQTSRGTLPLDPYRLAETLKAKALVFYEDSPDIAAAMSYYIPASLTTYGGAVRLYRNAGSTDKLFESTLHPFWTLNEIESARSRVLFNLNRRVSNSFFESNDEILKNIDDIRAQKAAQEWNQIEEIRLAQQESMHLSFAAKLNTSSDDEIDSLKKRIEKMEKENAVLREINNQRSRELKEREEKETEIVNEWSEEFHKAKEENERLKKENDVLKSNNLHLKSEVQRLQSAESSKPSTKVQSAKTVAEALDNAISQFPDRLTATAKARQTAKDEFANHFTKVEMAEQIFEDMANALWPIYFEEKTNRIKEEFENRSRFRIALSETKQTKEKKDLMDLRNDIYDGNPIQAIAHVKFGNTPGEQIRVHFHPDRVKRLIVISAVVDHYPTSSSRKNGKRD